MHFFRTRLECRGLALLALASLLFSSLGHVHPDGYVYGFHRNAALECRTFAKPPPQHQCPTVPDHSDCAICWAVGLAGSAVLPHPPVLALPATVRSREAVSHDIPSLHDIATAPFHARGPPLSIAV